MHAPMCAAREREVNYSLMVNIIIRTAPFVVRYVYVCVDSEHG